MRIDPSTTFSSVASKSASGVIPKNESKEIPANGEVASAGSTFSPTSDLTRLLQAVRDLPEVRTDVVHDVSSRAAAGELFTPQAAADTASGILDSQSIQLG